MGPFLVDPSVVGGLLVGLDGEFGTVQLHRTQSNGGNIGFEGAELTLMERLVQFNYTEQSLKGHSQVRMGPNSL